VFTSLGTVSVPENTAGTVYTAKATATSAITYSITGADAQLFSINATTGALAFVVAPDFENKKDADLNNKYEVIVTAKAAALTTNLPVTITVTNISTPGLVFVFPTAGADVGVRTTQLEFTAEVRFEDTESHTALPVADVVVTDVNGGTFDITQPGYVNGTSGLWVKKGQVVTGANTLTATASYNGQTYTAMQSFTNGTVVKPEAFALSVKDSKLMVFNGLYNSLNSISTIDGQVSEQALPADATPVDVFVAEYESERSNAWGYTLSKTKSGKLFVVRALPDFTMLSYVQIVDGSGVPADFVKEVTSMVLDENEDAITANDRLLVLQHDKDKGAAWVSSLNVGNKTLNDKSTAPIFSPQVPSLYTTVWTAPADITNADKIAYDVTTKTLVVLDKKAASSDVIGYRLNGAGTAYDVQKFKVTVGSNNSRLVTAKGKVYLGEGSTLANNLKITSIDAETGVKSVEYDNVVGTGPKLNAVTDIRINRARDTLYVLDGVSNSFVALNTITKARTLFKTFAVAAGPSFLPNDIAFDGFANYFVSDSNSGGIIGVGAANGARTVLRSGLTANGQNAIAQQIKYNDVQGLITAESLFDTSGVVTGKALAKTDVLSGTSATLAPFSPTFDIDQLGVYVDPAYGNFAVSIDGTSINVINLATNATKMYAPTNTYGFTPDIVSAVELDQKSGLLYVINNQTKELVSLDLKIAMAAPKVLATLPTAAVVKPTDIALDGTNVYYLNSGTLYKVDLTAAGANQVTTLSTPLASPGIAYADGYSPIGIAALGEKMDIDRKNKVMWISNKRGGAIIAVSLITGDRVVVAH